MTARGGQRLAQIVAGDPGAVDAFFAAADFDCAFLPEAVAVALYARLAAQLPLRTSPEAGFVATRARVLNADGSAPATRDGARAGAAWKKAVEALRAAIVVDDRLSLDVRRAAARALFAADRGTASLLQSVVDNDADAVDVDVAWRVLLARIASGQRVSALARKSAALRVAHAIAAHTIAAKAVDWPRTLTDTCGRAVVRDALAFVVDAGDVDVDVVDVLVKDAEGAGVALARVPRLGSAAITRLLVAVDVAEQHALAREHWALPAMRAAVAGLPRARVVDDDDVYVDLALGTLQSDPAPSIAILAMGGPRAAEELRALRETWLAGERNVDDARHLVWSIAAGAGDVDVDAVTVDAIAAYVADTSLSLFARIAELVLARGGAHGRGVVEAVVDELDAGTRARVRRALQPAPLSHSPDDADNDANDDDEEEEEDR
jgi:hypothetical protein